MELTIRLTEEQEKALLTGYVSIQGYAQQVIENRANRLMKTIVRDYADKMENVTEEEQAIILEAIGGRIVVDAANLPDVVKKIIVTRASTKPMALVVDEASESIR